GAIGHRNEIGIEGAELFDRLPERTLQGFSLGREKFERNRKRAHIANSFWPSWPCSSLTFVSASLSADQIFTVRAAFSRGAKVTMLVTRAPAALHQVSISPSLKPRRRCACFSRRNSRSCGAKSTINKRPPGFKSRTVSATARAGSERK